MAKDYAQERNKPINAKTKVSVFANFEVGCCIYLLSEFYWV